MPPTKMIDSMVIVIINTIGDSVSVGVGGAAGGETAWGGEEIGDGGRGDGGGEVGGGLMGGG